MERIQTRRISAYSHRTRPLGARPHTSLVHAPVVALDRTYTRPAKIHGISQTCNNSHYPDYAAVYCVRRPLLVHKTPFCPKRGSAAYLALCCWRGHWLEHSISLLEGASGVLDTYAISTGANTSIAWEARWRSCA